MKIGWKLVSWKRITLAVALFTSLINQAVRSADLTLDNLTVNGKLGVGVAAPNFQVEVNGGILGNLFYISGPHTGGSQIFLREDWNGSGAIYGPEVRNWKGAQWDSDRTQIVMYAGNPQDEVATTYLMDGSTSGESGEMRIGSYIFSQSSVVLFPGEHKTLTATAEGKVGIGTDNPTATLDVVGTVRMSRQGDILMGEFGTNGD